MHAPRHAHALAEHSEVNHGTGKIILVLLVAPPKDSMVKVHPIQVDKLSEGAHPDFRLFLSGEPPPGLERPLPISLLQNSIKLTNEPPEGLQVRCEPVLSPCFGSTEAFSGMDTC